jgi:hypothetical protein
MAALAAAPALAFGPPGWAVFAVAVAATAAVAYLAASQTRSRERTRTETRTRDVAPPCPRPWSVRVHAQGTDIGGTSGSTIGAPPIVQTSPVLVAQGVALAAATYALLGARQQRNLANAYAKCVKFIQTCGGFLGQKSFYGLSRDNNRFDVDSFGPSPNFVA